MKRLVLAIAAAATLAGPMIVASEAAAQSYRGAEPYRGGNQSQRYERNDRYERDNRGGYDNRGYDSRGYDSRGYDSRRGYDPRYDNSRRWDSSRNNGYYLGNRWYYGPPQVTYYNRHDYRPAYRAWTRGSYLPRSYWGYQVNDYRSYRLRQPPRGYHWVRAGNDYVLAAIATGLIADVILNGGF